MTDVRSAQIDEKKWHAAQAYERSRNQAAFTLAIE